MIKEEKLILKKVLVIVGVSFLLNLGVFFYKLGVNKSVTGLTIIDSISKTYQEITILSKVFLIMQWVTLILALGYVAFRDRSAKCRMEELRGINLKRMTVKKGTDLDTLYNILRSKKQLRISTVAKLFKIKKEMAMEWCKTLESGNLGMIDYPPIGEPVIKFIK